MTRLKLGYMPLTDSLPLLTARELGYFSDEGLSVELSEEVSWANIRDKVIVGQLDAAQMLAPMVLASSLGLGGLRKPMTAPMSLNLGGNAVTLSRAIFRDLEAMGHQAPDARALKQLVDQRRRENRPAVVLAVVFPYSSHNLLLRYWLASGGIDPDRDIETVVLPPSQMVDHLTLGHIDGFCAGAPWNTVASATGAGDCIVTGREIWRNAPNKVLGMTEDWSQSHPDALAAMMRALYRAGIWLDENRDQAVDILANYLPLKKENLRPTLLGESRQATDGDSTLDPDLLVFHRYLAGFPWVSHGYWLLEQMQRWGWLPRGLDLSAVAAACYRPDLYRRNLADTPLPEQDWKSEGRHDQCWNLATSRGEVRMGPDTFIDGRRWDPRTAMKLHQSGTPDP